MVFDMDIDHSFSQKKIDGILALDLGTKTGWSFLKNAKITSGTKDFKGSRFSGGGMRFLLFKNFLESLNKDNEVNIVFFEEIRRHKGVDAAHVYGGFLSHLTAWCEEKSIPYKGVGPAAIKKFVTGKGNASKQEVIESIKHMGFDPEDDNEADSLALLLLARQNIRIL